MVISGIGNLKDRLGTTHKEDGKTDGMENSHATLSQRLRENTGAPDKPLFVSNCQQRFSRDGIERIVRKYARMAAQTCPLLRYNRVSPPIRCATSPRWNCCAAGSVVWYGDCSARPRVGRNYTGLSPCRHGNQSTDDGSEPPDRSAGGN